MNSGTDAPSTLTLAVLTPDVGLPLPLLVDEFRDDVLFVVHLTPGMDFAAVSPYSAPLRIKVRRADRRHKRGLRCYIVSPS